MTPLNGVDKELVKDIAEETAAKETAKRGVTWPGIIMAFIAVLSIMLTTVWALHSSAKTDLEKRIDAKVDRERYCADIEGLKAIMQGVKSEVETLNTLHPRMAKESPTGRTAP